MQNVKSIATDCDKDVLLIEVQQIGAACHDGYYSCFYRQHVTAQAIGKSSGKRF